MRTGNIDANEGRKRGGVKLSVMWALAPALLISTIGAGCSSGASMGSPQDSGATGDTGGPPGPVGSIVTGTAMPCTEPHSICLNVTFPASMTAKPNKLQYDLYESTPPTHPPQFIPLLIDSPDIVAGETVQLRMTDVGAQGPFYFLGVVYMPGGGDPFPLQGVDYTGDTMAAYNLTGDALNVPETIDFHLFQ